MTPLRLRRIVAVVILLLIAAMVVIDFYGQVQAIKSVELGELEARDVSVGLAAATLILGLEIRNPSSHTITLEDIEYKIYVEDVEVAAGIINELTLQPNTSTQIPIEARVTLGSIAATIAALLEKGQVEVKVTIKAEAPIRLLGTIKTPISITLTLEQVTLIS